MKVFGLFAVISMSTTACGKELVGYSGGDIAVRIEAGGGWLHSFPLFMGIKLKNPPQIAIWTETTEGEYLETIYATRRAAEGKWRGGTPRPEALPTWNHVRGADDDGMAPMVDGISGATPKADFDVKMRPTATAPRRFVVKVEINHSADWNETWPEGAAKDTAGYSAENGQPSLVYAALVDLDSDRTSYAAALVGHGSPDGTDGTIRPDTSRVTSALDIAKRVTIELL